TTIIPGNALDIRCLLRAALHGCRSVGATFRAAGLPGWWAVPFLEDPGVELPGLVQTVGLPDPDKPVHRDPDLDRHVLEGVVRVPVVHDQPDQGGLGAELFNPDLFPKLSPVGRFWDQGFDSSGLVYPRERPRAMIFPPPN